MNTDATAQAMINFGGHVDGWTTMVQEAADRGGEGRMFGWMGDDEMVVIWKDEAGTLHRIRRDYAANAPMVRDTMPAI